MLGRNRPSGDILNDFVLGIFRLNGFFLNAADRLTAGSGLTAARWQVLGAVLHEPLTVAAIARTMGMARQSVQRVANVLVAEGFCAFRQNPAHRRAMLLASTDRGMDAILQLRPKVLAWSKRFRELVGEDATNAAAGAVDGLLSKLAEVEGQLIISASK
jgi:DNA-binding MarR family transcriptional regulator